MKTIDIIPSKSDAHRALICAALAEYMGGTMCDIELGFLSKDTEATRKCLVALLARGTTATGASLYCGESGSTFRFLLPVAGALGMRCAFYPRGRLAKRPMEPLSRELRAKGMSVSEEGSVPFMAEGQLGSGDFHLPGNVSSQFVSGLLFALPMLEGDSRIIVDGRLESSRYVDMTIKTQRDFGIEGTVIEESGKGVVISVRGGQTYRAPRNYRVEGDWSNAAFWILAGVLGDEPIAIKGLDQDSLQGDKAFAEVLIKAGADIVLPPDDSEGRLIASPSRGKLRAFTHDASGTPDLVPALALAASVAEGTSLIHGAARLRIKESDRLRAISSTLGNLGADIEEYRDKLVIRGKKSLGGGTIESFGDHRIAMMGAVASLVCDEKVSLIGADAVSKSYPGFFETFEELGLSGGLELI